MANFNKVILIGRITADPELKRTQSDIPVTSFSIAINRRFTKQGEQPQADFINIVCWRQQAEFVCKYFTKGMAILLTGSIQTRSYTDQQGNKRTAFEVVADEVQFVEPKRDGSNQRQDNGSNNNASGQISGGGNSNDNSGYNNMHQDDFSVMSDDDELPF